MVTLTWLRLAIGELKARVAEFRDLSVTGTVDFSDADELVGFPGEAVRGDYGSPAFETTETLTTGAEPAVSIPLPFKASALVAEGETQESGISLDDLFAVPEEETDGGNTIVNVYWDGMDPGSDETLNYTVVKAL